MAATQAGGWELFWARFDELRSRLSRSHSERIEDRVVRTQCQEVSQLYFRDVRRELHSLGFEDSEVEASDGLMLKLMRLAEGKSRRTSYLRLVAQVRGLRPEMASRRAILLGERGGRASRAEPVVLEFVERRIIETLKRMLPSAALSYEQAVRDLRAGDRVSFRGTGVELREALREVLDHLAPDDQVEASAGYKPEEGQKHPTMRQKARFVLRSRGVGDSARKTPEDTAAVVESSTSNLVRSTYERGNVVTHVAGARGAARQLKMYVDSVLAELLQIHAESIP